MVLTVAVTRDNIYRNLAAEDYGDTAQTSRGGGGLVLEWQLNSNVESVVPELGRIKGQGTMIACCLIVGDLVKSQDPS